MADSSRRGARTQSFLRWAGSKRQLVPVLKTYWKSEYRRYLEPFAGSACLFFAVAPRRAILGDLNAELISTYREIKYRADMTASCLDRLNPSKRLYRRLRSANPTELCGSARAARFIYLNRYCFNGLYRTNLKGEFNVPYGGGKTGNLPSREMLHECSRRLKHARLVAGDFEKVLGLAEPGDFVYMDPPFAVGARRVFKEYDPSGFGTPDIMRLRLWMEELTNKGIAFVVSYAESDEADFLRRGFRWQSVSVRRNISGFASHRCASREILVSNT